MKLLVIRMSSIGDVLLTTPLLRCLKQQLPGVEVHFLTKSGMASLVETNPHVDKVHILQESMSATVKMLRAEHFDFVADLHNVPRSRRLRRRLHVRWKSYRKNTLAKWLQIVTKRAPKKGRHVVERYFDAVRPLGVHPDDKGLECYLPSSMDVAAFANSTIGKSKVADLTAQPYVVIACGAQHATKRIPPDKLQFLASTIKKPILLLGDKGDAERIRQRELHFQPHVHNLCGKTTLMQTAALVRTAAVVVTPDTGIMHLAAAFQVPTIALWGATDPAFGFSAYHTLHADCVSDSCWCHPCSRTGGERCPLGHYNCMNHQKWQQICQTVDRMVSAKTPQTSATEK
ncbi:MAG: glycosyltransferase family 9 protein [Bacteroidales bacterium]|jgi:ADP-heptose:LPS heptosyltransferase|nr:glycosyltransferase family 9 protein [Bacteroidales bacterium]